MVVGDRLWLFSQPPHGPPAPLQSLLLNNVPPAPQHMSTIHPAVLARNYSSPSAQMIARPNQSFSSSTSPNYLNKQLRFEHYNRMQFSPFSRSSTEAVDFRFGPKSVLKSSAGDHELNTSNLASLESRFGNNSTILSENNKFQDAININDDSKSSSTSSDIDCEEIET